MQEESHQESNPQKSLGLSEELPKKEKKDMKIVDKLIFFIVVSIISYAGFSFLNCNFMIPGSINRSNALGGLKNPPSLDCKESEKRGYDALLSILTTIIALKTKVDD